MQKRLLAVLFAALIPALAPRAAAATRSVPNFALVDIDEVNHELYRARGRAVVLFFAGTGCPIVRKNAGKFGELARQYEAQGVNFWVVYSYADEPAKEIREERNRIGLRGVTTLRDTKQSVALALGVERTAEVIAIDTKDWKIFYRGAIDDQLTEGAERPEAGQHHLADALSAFLAGQEIPTARTQARGCRITFAPVVDAETPPDFATTIAPLLQKNCVECHRPDGIAPWSMNSHRRVANYAEMIEEVLLTRRMPPWDPHPDYGNFHETQRLSREETQTLLTWVKAGAPRGEGADPLTAPLDPLPEWRLGTPDHVLRLPKPEQVPATGVVDYRHIKLENPFTNDVWLSGMDIKPGNRKVVHHVILYVNWPGLRGRDKKGAFFVGWAPGASALRYPPGVAKRLPVGATLTVEMHYTTCGTEETDQSEIALYFAEGPQERLAETRQALQYNLDIPPGDPDAEHEASYFFSKPATLYGLFPHMHFRGKWMRYELWLPDGKRETLLHVPRYDFLWQLSYYLKEPRHVPAGTWLRVTGSFDNSAANPGNPDPTQRVLFGEQSWDEMFIGFFEAADDPVAPRTASR